MMVNSYKVSNQYPDNKNGEMAFCKEDSGLEPQLGKD